MILSDIKNYVKTRQQVSLQDVAFHFDVDQEAVRGMLEFWVSKGKIKKITNETVCNNSCACELKNEQEHYVWNPEIGKISIEFN